MGHALLSKRPSKCPIGPATGKSDTGNIVNEPNKGSPNVTVEVNGSPTKVPTVVVTAFWYRGTVVGLTVKDTSKKSGCPRPVTAKAPLIVTVWTRY